MGQTLTSSHSLHTSTAAQAAAQALLIGKNRQQKAEKKVLVVGSGCAGLAVAWHLNRVGVSVTLFEKEEKLGGHANTIVGRSSSLQCTTSLPCTSLTPPSPFALLY